MLGYFESQRGIEEECCKTAQSDPDCGNSWFAGMKDSNYPHTCYCEKKDYDCQRTGGEFREYRFRELPPNAIEPDYGTSSLYIIDTSN